MPNVAYRLGVRVRIVAPQPTSKKANSQSSVNGRTGVITREGSSSNGGWFEIQLDGSERQVYFRRGCLRPLKDGEPIVDDSQEVKDIDMDDGLSDHDDDPEQSQPASEGSGHIEEFGDNDNIGDAAEALEPLGRPLKRQRKKASPFRSLYPTTINFSALAFQGYSPPTPVPTELDPVPRRHTRSRNTGKKPRCDACKNDNSSRWHKRSANPLGLLLCHTCGSRFQKYKILCVSCWNVPHKAERESGTCGRCDSSLAKGKAIVEQTERLDASTASS